MPKGVCYEKPDVSACPGKGRGKWTSRPAADIAAAMREDELVATIPGDSFGAPANLRLTYTCSRANIEKGLDRIRKFFASVK